MFFSCSLFVQDSPELAPTFNIAAMRMSGLKTLKIERICKNIKSHPLSLFFSPSLLLLPFTHSIRVAARTGTLQSPRHESNIRFVSQKVYNIFPRYPMTFLNLYYIIFFLPTLFKCTFCLTASLLTIQPKSHHPDIISISI